MRALSIYKLTVLRKLAPANLRFAVFAFGFCLLASTAALGKEIHKEKSLYRNIVVKEQSGRRCLVFSVKRGDRNQTCMDLKDPKKLVFPYVRMTMGGLLVNSKPEKILVIGLGGGSIPLTLSELYPTVHIDIVEIDEAVIRVARNFQLQYL